MPSLAGKPYTFLEKSWKTIYLLHPIPRKTMPLSQNFLEKFAKISVDTLYDE